MTWFLSMLGYGIGLGWLAFRTTIAIGTNGLAGVLPLMGLIVSLVFGLWFWVWRW